MTDSARTTFLFDPSFDDAVDLLHAWWGLPAFDPVAPVREHVADLEAGRAVRVDGRFRSVVVTVAVGDHAPERLPALPSVAVELDEPYFDPAGASDAVTEHVTDYVDCIARFAERASDAGHPPRYVLGADPNQLAALDADRPGPVETTRDGILDDRLEQLYWLQVLSPAMADAVGRDALRDAPAWRVAALDAGAVLFVAYENPHVPDFDAKRRIEDRVDVPLHTYWV